MATFNIQNITGGNNTFGDNNFVINGDVKLSIGQILNNIKQDVAELDLPTETKESLQNEINSFEEEMSNEAPSKKILKGIIDTMKGITTGVIANALTPTILENINKLSSIFS